MVPYIHAVGEERSGRQSSVNYRLNNILEKYKNVFRNELTAGMPPVRSVDLLI